MKTVYEKVIDKIKKMEGCEYAKVESSIEEVCGEDPLMIKELYVEALDSCGDINKSSNILSVCAFGFTLLTLLCSVGSITKCLNILIYLFAIVCGVIVIFTVRLDAKSRYKNYVIQVIKNKYKQYI